MPFRLPLTAAMVLVAVGLLSAQVRVKRDVVYRTVDGQDLALDVHYPKGEGPFPVAVVIHGGGWFRGSRRSMNAIGFARILARDGVASATISYRLAPKATHPAQIEDCRRAVQWVRAHARELDLDAGRVAAVGPSAGGHLAGLLGAQEDHARPDAEDPVLRESTRPDLVLSFFGPMDLEGDPDHAETPGGRIVMRFLGVRDARDPAALRKARLASPLWQLQDGAPPFLFIHGTRDRLVPIEQSEKMARALDAKQSPNLLLPVSGGGHGDFAYRLIATKPGQEPAYWKRARAFLRRHWLEPRPAAPRPRTSHAFDVHRDLVYATRDGRGGRKRELKLDLYVPEGKGPWPVVAVLPGGGWRWSSRRLSELPLVCRVFAREGFAAAAVSYRTAPAHAWPAQFQDAARAVQWLRAHAARYGLDPRRVMATGASAGGHLASLVGTKDDLRDPGSADPVARESSRPRCVVAFCAPSWLEPHAQKDVNDLQVRIVSGLVGLKDRDDPKQVEAALRRAKDASPVAHVTPDDVPHLLVHGTDDPLVPYAQATHLQERLRRVGVSCEVIGIDDGGHGAFLGVMRDRDRFFEAPPDWWMKVRAFMDAHL